MPPSFSSPKHILLGSDLTKVAFDCPHFTDAEIQLNRETCLPWLACGFPFLHRGQRIWESAIVEGSRAVPPTQQPLAACGHGTPELWLVPLR